MRQQILLNFAVFYTVERETDRQKGRECEYEFQGNYILFMAHPHKLYRIKSLFSVGQRNPGRPILKVGHRLHLARGGNVLKGHKEMSTLL